MFQAVRKGEGDSYGQLVASQNILEHVQNTLRKNRSALDQPYFGRIVYDDLTYEASECCYIGKNGISKNQTDVIVVDWRAPVANVYYENSLGNGHYAVPGSSDVEIDLHQKRTYDISDGTLHGYYDDDIAANDDLLVKYLSQNKDAVLGDIIATIQKEQGIPEGIYVIEVDPDSPAMAAGIQNGDVIWEVGGEDVSSAAAYQRALFDTMTGDTVTLRGKRLGTDGYVDVELTVTVGSKEG